MENTNDFWTQLYCKTWKLGSLVGLALLVSACGSEQNEGEGQIVGTTGNALTELPAAARARREAEVNDHIADWHARAAHVIVDTITQENGDVVDLVAAESVPGSQLEPPTATLPVEMDRRDAREAVAEEPVREGAADRSVVRYVRPKYSRYVDGSSDAKSLTDFIRDQVRPGGPPQGSAPGTPCTNNCERLYAASRLTESIKGVASYVNANWSPGSTASGTFFLAQTNVIDPNTSITTNAEWIGWIIGRNPILSDTVARVYTEFFTAGTNNQGNYVGGWSGMSGQYLGFVPLAGAAIAIGDAVGGQSVVGGSQYAHKMQIEYFPAAQWNCGAGCTGSWWLIYDTYWVGHYPVGSSSPKINFNRITNSAPAIDWYGEIYDPAPGTWTSTDMGSAQYASSTSTWQQVGYFRNLLYQKAVDFVWYWPTTSFVSNPGNDDPDCYTRYLNFNTDPAWRTSLWFGGPGRTSTNGCDPF